MTKQEQIEEIARILKDHCVFHPERICDECIHKDRRTGDFMVCEEYLKAEELYNSGYGNTKQAVEEFAERFHQKVKESADSETIDGLIEAKRIVYRLVNEARG